MSTLDKYTKYEEGLARLSKIIDKKHPKVEDFSLFELRLKENIEDARLNGDNDNSKSERSRVLKQLTRLALEYAHCSFNDLCKQSDPGKSTTDETKRNDVQMPENNNRKEFDVFLCYNSEDLHIVRDIGTKLKEIGLKPWLDQWELRPGLPWQETLERQIKNIKSVAVFVGKNGIGPWHNRELSAFIRQFGKRECPVIPVILPDCKAEPDLPIFLEGFTWVDFRRNDPDPLMELKWGITGDRSHTEVETYNVTPNGHNQHEGCTVIPLGVDLQFNDKPENLSLPSGYRCLGQLEGLEVEHLYREIDGHVVLYFSTVPGDLEPFLIDKYAITAKQFCICLNDLVDKKIIRIERHPNFRCVDSQGRHIVFDALEQWQKGCTARDPWLHTAEPWGVAFQDNRWQPAAGSELLPVTNVTWWGARLYSLWCHNRLQDQTKAFSSYLPTVNQWKAAAQFGVKGQWRRYPWGDDWHREWVNHAGYWAVQEVGVENWRQTWASRADIYKNTRPLPVADLNMGRSSIGCVQMLGNVWEWCAGTFNEEPSKDRAVLGGACLSPKEHCSPDWKSAWRPGQGSEYIGFRCCFPISR